MTATRRHRSHEPAMAATGGGKIRSRRYKISAKPYAKTTQPGLISRVTDTVKSIVPSWLQKYFTNSDVAEGGGAVDQNSVAPPPPNGSEEGPPPPLDGRDSPEPSTSNTEPSTSRASLNFQDTVLLRPPLNRTHLHFPPLDLSSSALGAPSGLFSLPSTSSAPGPFSTGFSLVKEIKDNLSQHEDDNISTTSGFSSRASDKDIPVSKTASLPQLWSPPGTDRTHSGPQTTHSGLKKPTFNLSVFGSSSNSLKSSLLSSSQLGDSPFYPGKTTYGGAAAARSVLRTRLNQRPATPYQPPVRRQIKAKPAGAQPCGVTSATARRILQSLEHMSSPLADAKRIPSAASSLRLSASLDGTNLDLSHFQSKRKRMDSQLPPVQKLVVPTAVSVSGNRSVSFRPSLTPRAPKDTPTRQSPQLPDAVPGPSQSTTSSSGPTYPLSSTPAVSNAGSGGGKMKRERTTTRPSSKRPHDEEETVEVPDLPAISLPISSLPVFSFAPPPLPVTPAAKEPLADKEPPPASTAAPCVPFTFASPIVMATAASPPSSFSPSAGFTFSAPVAKMDLSISNDMLHTPVLAAVKLTNSTEEFDGPFKPAKTLKQGSVLDILKAHMDGNGFATPVASPVPDTPSQPIIAEPTASSSSSVGFGDQFKAPAGSWDCDVCMLRNKPADTKCVACNSSSKLPDSKPPPAAPAAPLENNTAGFVAMFAAPPTGTWGCDTCLVQNKPEAVKCVACETAKPGTGAKPPPPAKTESAVATAGFGDKFKKAEGAWECATCMVENKAQESKCVACTTAKPGAAPSPAPLLGFGDKFKKAEGSATVEPKAIGASAFRVSAFGTMFPEAAPSPAPLLGFGDKFKKAEGSWDCDVCCVQNQAAALQCVACQSTRPGATVEPKAFGASAFGASSESDAGGFKFGSSSNSTSGFGGFKFPGTPSDSTSSSSTDGFKFGASFGSSSSEASKDTCGSSGFKFGGSSKGFKFGASAPTPADDPTPDPPAVGSGFKFGAPSGAGGGGFSFGLSKPAEEEAAASTTTTTTTPPPPPPVGLPAEESGGGGAAETTSTTSGAAGPVFGRLGDSAAPAEQEAAAPTFSFGKPAEKDAATAGFLFSGKEAEATTGGSFSFSKPDPPKEQQPQPPAFTFGKPADKSAAPEAPKPSFSFGQSAADTAASKPAFAFMANATAATTTTSSSSCSTTPALSLFGTAGLGSPAATLSPFLLPLAPTPFQDTPPAKTFLFGQSQDSAAPVAPSMNSTPSQPFLFGAAAGTAPPAAPSFAFGAAAPPAASSAAPSAAPAPFVFSSPSSGGFGATQTPSFGSFALPPPTFSTGSSQAPPAFGSKPNATVFPQAAAFGAAPGPAFGLGSTCRFGAPSTNTGVFAFGGAAAPPTPSVAPSFAQPAFNTGSAQSSFPASPAGPPTIAGRKIKTAVRRRK